MVDFSSHVRRGHPIIFGLIVFFAIIEGAICTWLITRYDQHHNYPSTAVRDRVGFLTFTSWWTVLFGLIYAGMFQRFENALTSVGSHGVFLFLTWVFWTAGAASLTAGLGGGNNCSTIDFALAYCNQLNAAEGFAWTTWLFVTFALFVTAFRGVSSQRRGDGWRGSYV